MNVSNMQPSLKDVLDSIRTLPHLLPQERRVVLRELIVSCDENDIQILQRLLGQTTKSGFDLVSALPSEVSHNIFLYLDGMDLVRCRAVCRPWRIMVKGDTRLWKAKVQAWDPAECLLLRDNHSWIQRLKSSQMSIDLSEKDDNTSGVSTATVRRRSRDVAERDQVLDYIANQQDFTGWETAMVHELALKQNRKRGRYAYDMTVTLSRNIKRVILAWPILILVDDFPKLYKISLKDVRRDRCKEIPIGDTEEQYAKIMELEGFGTVSCVAWDLVEDCSDVDESCFPFALGGFLRSVHLFNLDAKTRITLPDVHHVFPLHLYFLRNQLLSITLDGQITFFHKGEDYRPLRSCNVATKVLQISSVDFGEKIFEREHEGENVSWSEAICLGFEGGVIIKDENSHDLCVIHLEMGSQLLQFQAIADNTPPYRNELLILFEEPNTRNRRVLYVNMNPGFENERSRSILTPSFTLGRGGDARDSITMYRDRIAIVSHRNCSSDLGHYCVLRLLDLKEDFVMNTEYAQIEEEEEEEETEDNKEDNSMEGLKGFEMEKEQVGEYEVTRSPRRGKAIHLNDFAGHKAACRVLAMDHARIVLGMGPRIVKILCLV